MADWQENYRRALSQLNPFQRAIVDQMADPNGGPVRVIAAAGAGKTTTVTTGVAHALALGTIDPASIVLTTFTRKARGELEHKLGSMTDPVKYRAVRVGTFHALAYRYMKRHDHPPPAHGWRQDRNMDMFGGDSRPDDEERARVQSVVATIRARVMGGRNDPDRARELAYPVAAALAKEIGDQGLARTKFLELFELRERSERERAGRAFDALWNRLGIPSASMLWRRVLSDWEVPGLETGGVTWNKDLQREIPALERGLDVLEQTGLSAKDYMGQVEILRGYGHTPADPEVLPKIRDLEAQGFARIHDAWKMVERAKKNLNAFDFADLLDAYWRRGKDAAKLIIVDEAQDNSFVQLDVSRQIAERGGGRLFLIGDVRQSIYSWRGAAPEIMASADKTIGADTLEIPTNYRSGKWIVDLGNRIAEGEDWNIGQPAIAARVDKATGQVPDGVVRILAADTPLDEARKVAAEIKGLIAKGAKPCDFAILTRTNAAGATNEIGGLIEGLPMMVLGTSHSFFDRADVKDALAFTMLAEGPRDSFETTAALLRVWKLPIDVEKPFHFLSAAKFEASVRRFVQAAGGDGLVALQAMVESDEPWTKEYKRGGQSYTSVEESWREDAAALHREIARLRETSWPVRLAEATSLILLPPVKAAELKRAADADEPPEVVANPSEDSAQERMAALTEIGNNYDSLGALLVFAKRAANEIAFYENPDNISKDKRVQFEADQKNRVTVSTTYKVKGLQFPYVYVSSTQGVFPSARAAAAADRERGAKVRKRAEEIALAAAEVDKDTDYRDLYEAAMEQANEEIPAPLYPPEEQRVFYVAVTRAADVLTVTYADETGGKPAGPSGFVSDFVEPIVEDIKHAAEAAEAQVYHGWFLELADSLVAPGWKLSEVSGTAALYEREDDGAILALESSDDNWSVRIDEPGGSRVLYLGEAAEWDRTAADTVKLYMIRNPGGDLDPVTRQFLAFLSFVSELEGQARQGLSWARFAILLAEKPNLRAAVMAEVSRAMTSVVEVAEATRAAPPHEEPVPRPGVWTKLPAFPQGISRTASAFLPLHHSVSVARPYRAVGSDDGRMAFLRVGSIVVLDQPEPGRNETDWVAVQVHADGTCPVIVETAGEGSRADRQARLTRVVQQEQAATWRSDPLSARSDLPEHLATWARYLYEATAGLPFMVTTRGSIDVPGADRNQQGKPVSRGVRWEATRVGLLDEMVTLGLLSRSQAGYVFIV